MSRTATALLWNMIRVVGQSGLGFIAGVVLARIIPPEEFGILAIAMVFIVFSEVVAAVGVSSAIVQRDELNERHVGTGITLSLFLATLFLSALWLSSGFVGEIYKEPSLTDALKYLAVGMWVTTATSVHRGLLMRELNFKQLTLVDFVSHATGQFVIAIALAVMGYGVWSMIYGTVIWQLIAGAWLVLSVKGRHRPSFHMLEAKQLLFFSLGVSLNNIINIIAVKVKDLLTGYNLGKEPAGLLNRANHTASIPFMKIALTISSVMLASYSEIQHDNEALRRRYYKAIGLISATAAPVLMGFAVCGEYVITGLYGDEWSGAVLIFQIMCVAGILDCILHLAGSIVQAKGKIYMEVRRQAVFAIVAVAGAWYASTISLEAVGYSALVVAVLLYLLMAQLSLQLIEGAWKDYFVAQKPVVYLSLPVVIVDYLAIQLIETYLILPNELVLLLLVAVSAATYGLSFILIPDRHIGNARSWLRDTYGHKFPAVVNKALALRSFEAEIEDL